VRGPPGRLTQEKKSRLPVLAGHEPMRGSILKTNKIGREKEKKIYNTCARPISNWISKVRNFTPRTDKKTCSKDETKQIPS